MKSALGAILLVGLVGVGLVRISGHNLLSQEASVAQQPVHQDQYLPLGKTPGRWVPFSANFRRVFDPGSVAFGKFYRASDGSTRSETGPSISEITVIGIKNMSEKVFYLWLPTSGWESHPMELPAGGYFQPRPDTEANIGTRRVDEQLEGIDLVRAPTDAGGATQFEAPRLNFFALKATIPCNDKRHVGCGLWHSDINIDEQPPQLFRPPEGVPITKRAEPGGIVRGARTPTTLGVKR